VLLNSLKRTLSSYSSLIPQARAGELFSVNGKISADVDIQEQGKTDIYLVFKDIELKIPNNKYTHRNVI